MTPIPMTWYVGCANGGLGFFHVDVTIKDSCQWLNLNDGGIIPVIHGSWVDQLEGVETQMSEAWDAN
jgi:hypothetical protein